MVRPLLCAMMQPGLIVRRICESPAHCIRWVYWPNHRTARVSPERSRFASSTEMCCHVMMTLLGSQWLSELTSYPLMLVLGDLTLVHGNCCLMTGMQDTNSASDCDIQACGYIWLINNLILFCANDSLNLWVLPGNWGLLLESINASEDSLSPCKTTKNKK